MRKVVVLFFVFLVASITNAVDKNVVFDEQAAWSYIRDMSTDDMLGRQSGHPGGVKGEEYIASRFEEWGIEPAGDDGTYFQTFTFPYWNVKQGTTLQIWAGGAHREFVYREDWRVQKFSGSGNFATEIVFAGYGIHAPDKDYDDYDGVDVEGKLVLLRTGAPKKLAEKLEEEAKIENRLEAAREHGARGVMVFRDPSDQSRYFRIRLEKEMYQPDFVILGVESRLTDFIFKEHENDLRFPFAEIDETSKPMSFATGVKVYLSVNVEFDAERKTRNVLAKITGSDPQLKDEYVVIGGHMDHLGVSPSGEVYNGANDNASGTALAMEIARVMKLGQANPKRTVIFGAWAAEEAGLLGSEHYCDHPTHPIEKTVTYINMDMVAHGDGKVSYSGVYYGPQVWEVLEEKLPKEMQEYIEPDRGGPGGSDHTPFLAKGVPAFGTWSQGHHFKYHQVRDDSDLVKPEILKKVGDLVYASVMIMADEPGDFFEPRRQDTYHLKVQNLVNYEFSNLDMVLEHHGDEKDSHVDIQFAVVPEKEELSGNDLRMGMIETLLAAQDKAEASKGLVFYISRAGVSANTRQGKTTIVAGLKGVQSFEDNPAWAKVLAGQGASFLYLEDAAFLFGSDALSDKGKAIVDAANTAGLLLMVRGANDAQAIALLEHSKKPVALLVQDVPAKDLMDKIKEKDSAVGLLLTSGAVGTEYFQKMEQVKEAIGTEHLMIVNVECVRHDVGKTAMLDVMAEMVKADYERDDFANPISDTFLRILDEARDVGPKVPTQGRPF